MLRRYALLTAVLAGSVLYLSACDGGGDEDTTVQQDAANIQSSLDGLLASVSALESGSFSTALKSFASIRDGEVDESGFAADILDELSDVLDLDDVERDGAFNFSSRTGVYAWSASTERWSRTGSSNDIVLQFPSAANRSTNNAELKMTSYRDASVTVDGESYRLPTQAEAELTIDGTRVFSLNLREAQFEDGDTDLPIPTRLDLSVFAAPLSHRIQLSRSGSTDYDLALLVENDGDRVIAVDAEVELLQSDLDEIEEEDVERVAGTVRVGEDLRVEVDSRPGEFYSLEDPSQAQTDALLSGTVFFGDQQIGDLSVDVDDEDVRIAYKDGSEESTDRFYDNFFDRLEAIVSDYLDLF